MMIFFELGFSWGFCQHPLGSLWMTAIANGSLVNLRHRHVCDFCIQYKMLVKTVKTGICGGLKVDVYVVKASHAAGISNLVAN